MTIEIEQFHRISRRSITDAGPRYTESAHVDLEISDLFEGLGRSAKFKNDLLQVKGELRRSFQYVNRVEYFANDPALQEQLSRLNQRVSETLSAFDTFPFGYEANVAEAQLPILAETLQTESEAFHRKLYDHQPPEKAEKSQNLAPKDEKNNYVYFHGKFVNAVRDAVRVTSDERYKLFVQPALWLRGHAGFGKTHLFCDIAQSRMERSLPTVLVLGQQLSTDDIWKQLCLRIGLPAPTNPKQEFLVETRKQSERAGAKTVILIDALNEGVGTQLWPAIIDTFIDDVLRAGHLALAVSSRTSYEHIIRSSERWLVVEHRGFESNLFQATKRYFQRYKIKSHEIPLVGEFRNPLFLKTYCEALEGYNLRSNVRGHIGIKSIHERYFHRIDSHIGKRLGYSPSINPKPCHKVAHLVAGEMADLGREWIPFERFVAIATDVATAQNIKGDFALELLNEGLFTRDYYYNSDKKSEEEGIRFGFQKFSDIFVARYLLVKNGLNKSNIAKKFKRPPGIQNVFKNWYRNQNLIEALATLIPEWTKGKHEITTIASNLAPIECTTNAFIDSLLWRDLEAFPSKRKLISTLRQVTRSRDDYEKILKAILSVSTTPGHPLNADFLDDQLRRKTMPQRDGEWVPFLRDNYDEDGVIPRIIEWPWNLELDLVSEDSLYLLALTLSWFLVTPDRYLRDRSTKALVQILTAKPGFALRLLKKFLYADDPYVVERIIVAIYGAMARAPDARKYKNAANYLYQEFFRAKKVPNNILIRHYAIAIVERSVRAGVLRKVSRELITPPFGSSWPRRISSKAAIEKKFDKRVSFERDDPIWGLSSIHSSVMGWGDFSRYVIGTNHAHHSKWRKKGFRTLDERAAFLRKSIKGKTAKNLYDHLMSLYKQGEIPSHIAQNSMAMKVYRTTEKLILESLSESDQAEFKKLRKAHRSNRASKTPSLSLEVIQRMVMDRIVSLGYNYKIHGRYDLQVGRGQYDRRPDKPERIGKKYQWIAYFDTLGIVSDHYDYVDWSGEVTAPDPEDLSYVDQIDPTITVRSKKEVPNLSRISGITFPKYERWLEDESDERWLSDTETVLPLVQLIERKGSSDESWLLLDGGYNFDRPAPPDEERYEVPRRTTFYIINSYFYDFRDTSKVRRFLEKTNFIGRWMPETSGRTSPHFAEFYNEQVRSAEFPNGVWQKEKSIPFKFIHSTEQYLYEKGTFDCSLDETLHIYLPSYFLGKEMHLNFGNFDGVFSKGASQKIVAFNAGSSDECYGLMFKKNVLIDFLAAKKLGIFWTILSEKNLIGGRDHNRSPGRLELSSGVMLEGDKLFEVGAKVKYNDFRRVKK